MTPQTKMDYNHLSVKLNQIRLYHFDEVPKGPLGLFIWGLRPSNIYDHIRTCDDAFITPS